MKNELTNYTDGFFDPLFDFFTPDVVRDSHVARGLEMRTDVTESESAYELDVDLPGINKDDITVTLDDGYLTIKAKANETILNALERSDIAIRAKCHLGGCGYCRSRLLKGTVACTKLNKQSDLDKKLGYIHPCCTYPTSDLEIEVYKY